MIKGEDVGLQEFPLPEGYIQEQEQAAESRTAAPEQLAPVPEDVQLDEVAVGGRCFCMERPYGQQPQNVLEFLHLKNKRSTK